MVPWSFLSVSLNDCAFASSSTKGLIRKIYLPKLVFPLARVLIALVDVLASRCGALFVLLLPLGARPSLSLLFLAGGDRALRGVHSRPGVDRGDCRTRFIATAVIWSPVVLPGVVLRDADPVSARDSSGNTAVVRTSQSGVFVHRDVSRHFVSRAMAPDRTWSRPPRRSRRRAWGSGMPRSSLKKTRWSSDSDRRSPAGSESLAARLDV